MAESNGTAAEPLGESERQLLDTVELLQERIAELELAQEDAGWMRADGAGGDWEFGRDFLGRIAALARLYYLKNPLVRRAADVQADYVFGQGMSIQARHPLVNAVVQAFLDDAKNQAELTGHQSLAEREIELQTTGNVFFAFFARPVTGRVRVRTIPFDEVKDVVCNPEDRAEPWYYLRKWSERRLDPASGEATVAGRAAYYPDWRHRPPPRSRPARIGDVPVQWDVPVYHVKAGGLAHQRFGASELYPALDWSKAYKTFLEDVATIMRALSRFAAKVTTKGGAAGVAAARSKLGTTVGTATAETNPPPVAGSLFIGAGGVDINPLQVRGATVNPEDGRRLLLMVAAAVGLPETFFGDVSVGTLATATAMDRPTELRFKRRQTLWVDVHRAILQYVVDRVATAPRGPLDGRVARDDEGDAIVVLADDPATGKPIDRRIDVTFPPLLEHDIEQGVKAITQAATLGSPGVLAGTLSAKLTARLLLQALGVPDIDEVLAELFPDAAQGGQEGEPAVPAAEARLVERRLVEILTAQAGVLRAWVTSGMGPRELLAAEDLVDGVRQ